MVFISPTEYLNEFSTVQLKFFFLFQYFLESSLTSSIHQTTICNPHSTTSPKTSPNHERNFQSSGSSQEQNEENEMNNNNNNNVDDSYENDDISVTGSPQQTHSTSEDLDDENRVKRSPTPTGAFTSLIQKSPNKERNKLLNNNEILSGFSQPQINSSQNVFNHALAAQLLFQTPLIPPPSQWLYTQLYSNYQEFPWFRNTLPMNGNSNNNNNNLNLRTTVGSVENLNENLGVNLVKRSVTLISHNENDEQENRLSPPVTSTKRSPSPELKLTNDDDDDIVEIDEIKNNNNNNNTTTNNNFNTNKKIETLRSRTPKQTDVWRPY